MKGLQPDPDEGMRTGEASFSISTGISEEEHKTGMHSLLLQPIGESAQP